MRGQRKYNEARFTIGCYVDKSWTSADSLNRATVEFARGFGFRPGRGWDKDAEALSEVADEAVSHLNELERRSFMSWGFENNSLFLIADVNVAREDVGFVSGVKGEYPPDEYVGEWLHVSDHGNATLFARVDGKDEEIWSMV